MTPDGQVSNAFAAALYEYFDLALPAELRRFIKDWPGQRRVHDGASNALPAIRFLDRLPEPPTPSGRRLLSLCQAEAASLTWRQSYSEADFGSAFLKNYGFIEVVGKRSALYSESMAAGLLLFGPQLHYPAHRHEAEELYLPLAGIGDYLMPDNRWQAGPPGTVIHNDHRIWHGTRTRETPVLIAWAWLGSNLTQKSEIA